MRYIKEYNNHLENQSKYFVAYINSFVESNKWVYSYFNENRVSFFFIIKGEIIVYDQNSGERSSYDFNTPMVKRKDNILDHLKNDTIIGASIRAGLDVKLRNTQLICTLNVEYNRKSDWYDIENIKSIESELDKKKELVEKLKELNTFDKSDVQISPNLDAFVYKRFIDINIDDMYNIMKKLNK